MQATCKFFSTYE